MLCITSECKPQKQSCVIRRLLLTALAVASHSCAVASLLHYACQRVHNMLQSYRCCKHKLTTRTWPFYAPPTPHFSTGMAWISWRGHSWDELRSQGASFRKMWFNEHKASRRISWHYAACCLRAATHWKPTRCDVLRHSCNFDQCSPCLTRNKLADAVSLRASWFCQASAVANQIGWYLRGWSCMGSSRWTSRILGFGAALLPINSGWSLA